ncbi:hypothetical protein INR49_019843 [Caranx melampygus]|nr:hypothetical protein INR49_019843 [Caranx melampygus]
MHQRLVVTSYLRQAERTGQLHSCSRLSQSKDLMENHVLMDMERHILCTQSTFQFTNFLSSPRWTLDNSVVPCWSKLELTGGKWPLLTHVSASLTQDLGGLEEKATNKKELRSCFTPQLFLC